MQFVTVFIMINGFIFVICSLIALSARFLKQTGEVELKINGDKKGKIERGQTLLSGLAENDLFLPAACGGKGTCLRCRLKVEKGGGPLTPLERIGLKKEEVEQGLRLACQIRIREDISVLLSRELLLARKFRARLEKAQFTGEAIRSLEFLILNSHKLEFIPGQYIQIYRELPHEKILRAYSVSSDPAVKDRFTLDVQFVAGGLMSTWLHRLEPGTELEISGPYGEMTLESVKKDEVLILVAGGVGLAPLKSMIYKLLAEPMPPETWLFWGARHRSQLYAEKQLRDIQSQNKDWFRFFPVLSGDLIEEGWSEDTGLVHKIVEKRLPEQFHHSARAFICGPGPMMKAVTHILEKKGLNPDQISSDPFDFD
jgi:Na+-transporting NADH:ubiquinone oxidoreductase subunit F